MVGETGDDGGLGFCICFVVAGILIVVSLVVTGSL